MLNAVAYSLNPGPLKIKQKSGRPLEFRATGQFLEGDEGQQQFAGLSGGQYRFSV
jgi:hypothetical protein